MVLSTLKALPRDLRFTAKHLQSLYRLGKIERSGGSIGKLFDQYALKNPEKVAIYFEDQRWTFKEIGAITALINFNLRSLPLKHSFQLANAKAIVCGNELYSAVSEIYPGGATPAPVYISSGAKGEKTDSPKVHSTVVNLHKEILRVSSDIPMEQANTSFQDGLFLLYTSGTTGLPKSAVIKHARFLMAGVAVSNALGIQEDDTIYTTLPLYHTNAGVIGVSQTLIRGTSLSLRHKFSATNFWKDCIKYKATVAQYMGETCRYLLRQPQTPEEKLHKVRLMMGNGLRAEIWEEFVSRFNIKQIGELYGSTEGNASCANYTNQVGACGFVPLLLKRVFPLHVVKLDEAGNPVRNEASGLVQMCKPGEPGELVCEIVHNHPFRDFKGYVGNKEANEKKIVRDVLKKGDAAFRSGDLFVQDELGFLYFKDRMGETYRWKGENVSTTEVEYLISNLTPEKNDVIVFGVKIPFTDGQCGMAVIADKNRTLDLNELTKEMKKCLPSYAIPLFLRLVNEIEQTGTHKMMKKKYLEIGYGIDQTSDIYFFENGAFKPLTPDLYEKIVTGNMKL